MLLDGRQAVVQERAERLVTLLQADAVGLVGEGGVHELEGPVALLNETGQDGRVRRDGDDPTVREFLGALRVRRQ